jgi:glycosyltransferase involved in cell wall biosynthesis
MPKNILYIGNKLSGKGKNLTTIETLSQKLKDLSYNVRSYSDQSNKLLRLCAMLFGILKHRKFDLVLIDTYSTTAFWFAWASAKLSQILHLKYIMILHGGNLPQRLKSNTRQCKSIFKKAYFNVTPSPYLLEEFKKSGYSNLKNIPNYIEIENYNFKYRKTIQPNLLWVRAFDHIYNPILALKVLELLRKDYPQASLCMIGPYKDKSIDSCKSYAKKYSLPVKFTGKMSKQDWIKYSEGFDIFINTTNVDNTPISVIEAMALGLPVVSTNVGGIPYLLDHEENALLVPPDNAIEMCSAIRSLIDNHDKPQNISKNARQKAEQFDWENIKLKWLDILQ